MNLFGLFFVVYFSALNWNVLIEVGLHLEDFSLRFVVNFLVLCGVALPLEVLYRENLDGLIKWQQFKHVEALLVDSLDIELAVVDFNFIWKILCKILVKGSEEDDVFVGPWVIDWQTDILSNFYIQLFGVVEIACSFVYDPTSFDPWVAVFH